MSIGSDFTRTAENIKKELCIGCGVCANICPSGSIELKPDEEGFSYPTVDASTCNGCGNCVTHCPALNPPASPTDQEDPLVFAAWSLDKEVRYNSTSGGIFTELARAVLNQNGYVVGAKYNDKHQVEHAMIDRIEDIPLLRQSKYVQSDTRDIYKQVETALQTGKPVLFVGTPCQCAGISVFLGKRRDNLILCDFICRGVNSPMVYLKYLEELETLYQSRVKQVWFKNKTYGWNRFCTKIIFENGQEYLGGRDTDPFMFGYIKKDLNLYMRPSCGLCQFKGSKRPVDMTLGDFWGLKQTPATEPDHGISVVMLHSQRALYWFDKIQRQISFEERSVNDIIPGNPSLIKSAEIGIKSEAFYAAIKTNNFSEVISGMK